jgi:hypothetical protein
MALNTRNLPGNSCCSNRTSCSGIQGVHMRTDGEDGPVHVLCLVSSCLILLNAGMKDRPFVYRRRVCVLESSKGSGLVNNPFLAQSLRLRSQLDQTRYSNSVQRQFLTSSGGVVVNTFSASTHRMIWYDIRRLKYLRRKKTHHFCHMPTTTISYDGDVVRAPCFVTS